MRCWLALFLACALTSAHAADDGARDAARATITRQAEALVRDDATTAYAQAAPSIQTPSRRSLPAKARRTAAMA